MNKIIANILILVMFLASFGCATTGSLDGVDNKELMPGEDSSARVGETFFSASPDSAGAGPEITPFYLTVLVLNDREIIFKYVEYDKDVYTVGETGKKIFSKLKKGTKTFTYSVKERYLRFNDFHFELLSVKKGKVIYRRVR